MGLEPASLKEVKVKNLEISVGKSSEPQVGLEPASIAELRKYDALYAN